MQPLPAVIHPRSLLVWLSIGVQVGLPLGAGASVLLQGGGASSLPLLLLAALLVRTADANAHGRLYNDEI
jgi:hypothetical protein